MSLVTFFQGEEEPFYSIKYQIKEGDCPVQSGKSWQDCDYKEAEQAVSGMLQSLQVSLSALPDYFTSAGDDKYCEPVCVGCT